MEVYLQNLFVCEFKEGSGKLLDFASISDPPLLTKREWKECNEK